MEPGRECLVVQEAGPARAEQLQTGSISTQGSLPALPPSSGYLEQIHGLAKLTLRRVRQGEEQQVQTAQVSGRPQQPLQGTEFARITLY